MHTVRPLYAWEIRETRRVFADTMNYDSIRIHENTSWPNTVNKIGKWLRRAQTNDVLNAITLGNHCYFPVKLPESPVSPDHPENYKIGWLIHELTHAWQYQRLGWRYLPMSLDAQFRKEAGVYDFGGEEGLVDYHKKGQKLAYFNPEQQADIARTYYDALLRRRDVTAWQPFVEEFQGKESV